MIPTVTALALMAFAFIAFVRLERQGRPALVFTIVLAYLVVESVLYPSQNEIPVGIFHPGSGELTFRIAEAIVAVALAARLVVRGAPMSIGIRMLWWVGFFIWLATAAAVGVLSGNGVEIIAFEAKAIVYLGAMAIGAGVGARALMERGSGLLGLIRWCAGLTAVLAVTHQAGIRVQAQLPLLPIDRLGEMSPDLATILSSLGAVALVLAAMRRPGHRELVVAGAALVVVPAVVSGQRAALLAASMTLLVVLVGLATARHRDLATPTEMVLATAAIISLALAPSFVRLVAGGSPSLPFSESVETAFTNQAKIQSAQARINQLNLARALVVERPIGGWGLGTTYTYFQPGPDEVLETNLTHNIIVDLTVRTGAIGALFFLVALAGVLSGGWGAWRRHPDALVAALGLAAMAAVVGLIGKGLVESTFEKYRVATLLGLFLGALRSSATSIGDPAEVPVPVPRAAVGRRQGEDLMALSHER